MRDKIKEELQKLNHEQTKEKDIGLLALEIGTFLVENSTIFPLSLQRDFRHNLNGYYQFSIHSKAVLGKKVKRKNFKKLQKKVLNLREVCVFPKEDPTELAKEIKIIMTTISSKFIVGKKVKYEEISKSKEFKEYLSKIKYLQTTSLSNLSQDQKKAFFINIYNSMVIHGFIEKGKPKSLAERYFFFDRMKYLIDNAVYSLNDIEHGILRGNKPRPYSLTKQIKSRRDIRTKNIIWRIDPRIHFALNCGSIGCPPIRYYSGDGIAQELSVAAEGFIQTEVKAINEKTISLSQIFKWYLSDFGSNSNQLKKWILSHYPEIDTKRKSVLEDPNSKVIFHKYDWTHNDWLTNKQKEENQKSFLFLILRRIINPKNEKDFS